MTSIETSFSTELQSYRDYRRTIMKLKAMCKKKNPFVIEPEINLGTAKSAANDSPTELFGILII